MMYGFMKIAINNKRFTKEDIQNKADVFYFNDRLTEVEYNDLCSMIKAVYAEPIVSIPIEPVTPVPSTQEEEVKE